MTNIQFYLIKTDNPSEQMSYALLLALQLLARGKHLHIHTGSAPQTRQMHEMFVGKLSHGDERLSIDHSGEPGNNRDVLLNLSTEVPHFFSSFESTLEVICTELDEKNTARDRYRFYKARGYPLRHTDVAPQLAF